MESSIIVRGAREHNLKDVHLEIPRDQFVVITGLSGSGKSSLAFDTIYAEGQRRYVESLSAYARQFLGQMEKPDVDSIEGLSPAISIEQKSSHRNPRSTVGTVTEIYDYLRLLFARLGDPHCHICDRRVESVGVDQIVETIRGMGEGTKVQILAPLVRGRKGEHRDILERARKAGFARVRVDGLVYDLEEEIPLEKNKKHSIEIIVDRLIIRGGIERRLSDSVETALHQSEGTVLVLAAAEEGEEEKLFSQDLYCHHCDISVPRPEPRGFSFNSPQGACSRCDGLGHILEFDELLIVEDDSLSLHEGCLAAWGKSQSYWYLATVRSLAETLDFDPNQPWGKLPAKIRQKILYGLDGVPMTLEDDRGNKFVREGFEGVIPNLKRRYLETKSESMRRWMEQFMNNQDCPACRGARLRPESLAVRVLKKNISEISDMGLIEARDFLGSFPVNRHNEKIARPIMKEILERLGFLIDVGVGYLTMSRAAGSLSGGEAQRIRLATQIGSALMGVLYILDEPSIGLHQRDNDRLLKTLRTLRDLGNTVIVVEHDEDTIASADFVVDMGPLAGSNGGEVVASGSPAKIAKNKNSITGQYLRGVRSIHYRSKRREGSGEELVVKGARENNLRDIDVSVPLGKMVVVTGVSGSGKSTLVNEILYKASAAKLMGARSRPGRHKRVTGLNKLDKVINIDQSPIGRTPRSNPATYTGVFGPIRDLFAATPEARMRGYKPGRFSFNVAQGRCEHCEGAGILKIEMHFLPDVYVVCEICKGHRFNRETLEVTFKGKNIYQVLEMTIEEAAVFFENIPSVKRRLDTLLEVGLGYIKLGQPATTLSGGEAQRVKLASELAKRSTGRTLYILDEPTTGLHFEDIRRLMAVLDKLVDGGNSMIIIEHNLDVIKCADWILDMGPEGGSGGGTLVCSGTPEELVARHKQVSHTARFLESKLTKNTSVSVPGKTSARKKKKRTTRGVATRS